MTNPALLEMAAQDRTNEMRRARTRRLADMRAHAGGPAGAHGPVSAHRVHGRANPQRAIGWFLVSVGLRLALPPARAGSLR